MFPKSAYFVPETLNLEQAEVVVKKPRGALYWFKAQNLEKGYSLVVKVSTSYIFLVPISSMYCICGCFQHGRPGVCKLSSTRLYLQPVRLNISHTIVYYNKLEHPAICKSRSYRSRLQFCCAPLKTFQTIMLGSKCYFSFIHVLPGMTL